MRQHHFDYGKALPIYQSLAKETFKQHNMKDAMDKKAEARL
jgi:hypothetical protein